jgi:uncharacterized protein DUF3822
LQRFIQFICSIIAHIVMLKPAFNIQSDDTPAEIPKQYRLIMEVSTHACAFLLLDVRKMSPDCIRYYQFEHVKDKPLEEVIHEIMEEDDLFLKEIADFFLVYNFEDSNLVPDKFFNIEMNKELCELVYGNLEKGFIFSEKIPWWELQNVYRVPSGVHNLLQQKFDNAKHWHAYSLLLKSHKMFTAKDGQDLLKVIFYAERIIVTVFKNGHLQLMQAFIYQDAKDVIYHLLNCSSQFNLNTEELQLEVSGLIDKHSSLFREVLKYFVHISFEEIGDTIKVTDELNEYPLHYFSSLLKMAVCV